MNIVTILTIVIVLVVVLELAKHQVSKIVITSLLIGIVLFFILAFVTSNLALEGHIDSDNAFVSTGASILKTFKESELAESTKDSIDGIKSKIKGEDDDF